MSKLKRVVIIGGGFAGLKALNKLSEYSYKFEITLIDKNEFTTLKPKLTSIASGKEVDNIKIEIAPILREYQAIWKQGEVQEIDTKEQIIKLKDNSIVKYDYLILANGVEPDYLNFNKENFYSFSTYNEASKLSRAISNFTEGNINIIIPNNPINENSAIELSFLIKERLTDLQINNYQINIITAQDKLCPDIKEKSRKAIESELKNKDINIIYNADINAIEKDKILLKENSIKSDLSIVVPSFKISDFIKNANIKTDKNGVVTDNRLKVDDHKNVLAIGDINTLSIPKLAHNAFKQADIAIDYILEQEDIDKNSSTYKSDILFIIEIDKLEAILVYTNDKENIDFSWKSFGAKELKVIFKNSLFFSLGDIPTKLDEGIKKLIKHYIK